MAGKTWEADGVDLGGQYLGSSIDGIRAAVHDLGDGAECHIWTPGCGFSPTVTIHGSVSEAKLFAEQRLLAITGEG